MSPTGLSRYRQTTFRATTRQLQVALVPVGQEWCTLCCTPRSSFADLQTCSVRLHTGRHASLNWLCVNLPAGKVKSQLCAIWKQEWNCAEFTKRGYHLPSYWSCCATSTQADDARERGCTATQHRVHGGVEGVLQIHAVNTCFGTALNLTGKNLYVHQLTAKKRVDSCNEQPYDKEDAYRRNP